MNKLDRVFFKVNCIKNEDKAVLVVGISVVVWCNFVFGGGGEVFPFVSLLSYTSAGEI